MVADHHLSSDLVERHNKLFDEACSLLQPLIRLDDVGGPTWRAKRPGWFARRRLHKAIRLLRQVLEMNQHNVSAMIFTAKAHQTLVEFEHALDWMLRAHELAPDILPVAIEAGGLAGTLGKYELSIEVTERVLRAHPNDPRLHFNLGITQILVGRANDAVHSFEHTVRLEPDRPSNQQLLDLARKIASGSIRSPRTQAEIAALLRPQ